MTGAIIAGLLVVTIGMTIIAWGSLTYALACLKEARRSAFREELANNLLQRRRDRKAGVKRRAPNGQFAS